jgi:sugar lactone lactonase YvrE
VCALTYALMSAAMNNPLERLAALTWVGQGLNRPECVLANAAGDLYTADWRGGVAHLRPDGSQVLYAGPQSARLALQPNGIALLADGSFLLAHLGADDGGVFTCSATERSPRGCCQVDGVKTCHPPTSWCRTPRGNTWVTVSTRLKPRALGYRRGCNDGFIVCVRPDGQAFIAAEGLGYTNEVAVHPSGLWLYVNETFARRLSRFALRPTAARRQAGGAEFGAGTFPDGLAFDEEGSVPGWSASSATG